MHIWKTGESDRAITLNYEHVAGEMIKIPKTVW